MATMSVSSLALGVHGRLTGHRSDDHDCYSAFHALSSTLGWASMIDGTATGLWGMNDAGGPWFGEDAATLRGWFQVAPERRMLPVEALTDAAVRTLERFGALEVDGLEYYVPVGDVGPAARRLLEGQAWFALAPPGRRARLRVTLDSGDSAAVAERGDAIVESLIGVVPAEEGLDAARLPDEALVDFAEPVPWRWWLGDATAHTATFAATATEWSPLGLGRVVSCFVEACRTAGLTEPVGFRVVRG